MKTKSLIASLLSLGLLLAGCNSGGEYTPVTPSGDTPVKPDEEPPSEPPVKSFLIIFKDENGNVLSSLSYAENTIPSYNYVKNDTAEWDYTFYGWSLTIGGEVIDIPPATEDATYFAVVGKVKQQYRITFYDENNNQLNSDMYEYGATPSCSYTGPSDTAEYKYGFLGWATSPSGIALTTLPIVTQAANYYALVTKAKQEYVVTFLDDEGNVITAPTYRYGEIPSCSYTKTDTQEYDYTFLGWSLTSDGEVLTSLPQVTGTATYYAIVSKVKNQYTLTFVTNEGSAVNPITADYGTEIDKPANPQKEGYAFTAWSKDTAGEDVVSWPYTITQNETFYANYNEAVDIKQYLQSALTILNENPYQYIPDSMKEKYEPNFVSLGQVDYDFTEFTNVSDITYGGFGEQWHMLIENINQTEMFYMVPALASHVLDASMVVINNFLDNNPSDTVSKEFTNTEYNAMIKFEGTTLEYSLQCLTSIDIPVLGSVNPQLDVSYNILTNERYFRIQVNEDNVLYYSIVDNTLTFAFKYGVELVNRSSVLFMDMDESSTQGELYEFIQAKNSDLVSTAVNFYINDTYTSVVGNKASGMAVFDGYINELYLSEQGRLLGYEVRERFSAWGLVEKQYDTLWFNLKDINGITKVKAIKNTNAANQIGLGGKNPHDIYINNQEDIFEPMHNTEKILFVNVKTSRKYDIELRKQYFYGYDEEGKIKEYEVEIPMMFIQAGDNYLSFTSDIASTNNVSNAYVKLSSTYVNKIQSDYASLIDIFIESKDDMDSSKIADIIGSPRYIWPN